MFIIEVCQEGIEIREHDAVTEIKVTDSGIGIPEDQKPRLFSRFFRAQNAVKVETDGTGLGLYIVKSIVEKHHGKIWFESTENVGTTFFIELPTGDKHS